MSPAWRIARGLALAGGLAAVLAACVLPPPAVRATTLRADAPVATFSAPAGGEWPSADWWQRYGDTTLDQLVALALQGAPSLSTADARFASARQSVRLTSAAQGVQVEAMASAQRQRLSDNGLLPPEFLGFNWYSQLDLGIKATYSFDWWGKQKASIEAAVDEAHAAQAERAAASLILAAAVADSYFGWQADQQRLQLARERLAIQEREAAVAARRIEAQLDRPDTARVANQDLSATRETIAVLEGSARLRVVTLAALLGRGAEEMPPLSPRPLPQLSAALPDSVKLDLIARRPDITASRWRVEAARQSLVSARAEYYPDVSINVLAALQSIEPGTLLQSGSSAPAMGVAIHLPLYDAGLRDARYGARQALVDAAIANYDETVVAAAREVATAASAGLATEAQRQQRELQLIEARALADAAAARVRAGTADIRAQLVADLQLNAGQDTLTQLRLAALSADVALRRALGGGYLAREETP